MFKFCYIIEWFICGFLAFYRYETKKRVNESVYDIGKKSFHERRGGQWRALRPRQLRQLESKLRDLSVVFCDWTNDSLITIMFSSGAIAYLTVKPETLDVTQILFDRYCVGRLSNQTVSSGELSGEKVYLSAFWYLSILYYWNFLNRFSLNQFYHCLLLITLMLQLFWANLTYCYCMETAQPLWSPLEKQTAANHAVLLIEIHTCK